MASIRYIVDTSVLARLAKPAIADEFVRLRSAGQIGITGPVEFEVGFSARSHTDHTAIIDGLSVMPRIPTTDADFRRAVEIQGVLARTAQHRAVSLVDALLAASAEARSLTVLHYDSDFETIAAMTGQRHQWIVERGTADE